jgi:chromate reductase, NAD(P)H dehydrogenase (quinone)
MTNKQVKILGISGSFRKDSFNTAVLRNAQGLVPENAVLEIFNIKDIPPFNQDLEQNLPQAVIDFKQRIIASDGILFVTPEYNYSIPGVLKNAIDWASRPYGNSAWSGKTAAIISASPGMLGGSRAQYHLRQVFIFLDVYPLMQPEVIIPLVTEKFSKDGQLTDEKTKAKIAELLQSLVIWTIRLQDTR